MHLPTLISDLAIMLLTAAVVTVLFRRIKQPLVLGYIVAGFLIGPYMPLFFTVADETAISTWSEIGIIILMFGLGLEFNLHKLLKVGATGLVTALTEVGGMLLLGYFVGKALGWKTMECIFLGGMLSMSSTTIIIKAFDELGVAKERYAQLVFGTLVVEDIAGIFMMIVLSTVSVSQSISGGALALRLGFMVMYLALWLLIGIFLIPTIMKRFSPVMNDEMTLIGSLGICFGMVLLADALGFSSALGAFMAGSLLAGTVHAEKVEHLTGSVKDLFGAVFFMSVGMMLDPSMVVKYIVPILIVTVVAIFGKLFFSSLGVLLAGQSLSNAIHCGCSLTQIGEFAFIIASLGMSLGVMEEFIYPIIISVSVITTLTTPFFIKHSDGILALITRILPKKMTSQLNRYTEDSDSDADSGENDWAAYLKQYARLTLLYGVIMAGISVIGVFVLYPMLQKVIASIAICKVISIIAVYFGIALFVRPMIDTHSTLFTTLWVTGRQNRLPLMALTVFRFLLIAIIAFFPLVWIIGMHGLYLLPIIILTIFIASRMGWISSLYLSVKARFLANLNERLLDSGADGKTTEWLDEKLLIDSVPCPKEIKNESLNRLGWGRRFGINVVKIVRKDGYITMPSGTDTVSAGDMLYVVGEPDQIKNFRIVTGNESDEPAPTLREYVHTEDDDIHDLYTYAIEVGKGSGFSNRTIRDTGIREKYDCIILGVQRNGLPLVQPDVDLILGTGDYIWVLGTHQSAQKLLVSEDV